MIKMSAFEDVPSAAEDPSESRDSGAKTAVGLLDKLRLTEILSSEEKRWKFFKNLDFQNFRDFLIRINGISRGILVKKREIDGRDVVLDAGVFGVKATPDFKDKETLLRDVYELSQQTTDIKSAALLIGAGIVIVHPFSDGNGRTARLVFTLLWYGYDSSSEGRQRLVELLGESGRRKLDLAPTYIQREIMKKQKENMKLDYMNDPVLVDHEEIRGSSFSSEISTEKRETFIRMVEDGYRDYALMAIYEYLLGHGKMDQRYFHTISDSLHDVVDEQQRSGLDFNHTAKTAISLKNIIAELHEQDVDEILNNNARLKREHVYLFADAIIHPEKYPFMDTGGWGKYTNLKEYYLYGLMSRYKDFFSK